MDIHANKQTDYLCFCPPDTAWPLSPTTVLYPSGKPLMKLSALALAAASYTCCSDADGLP